MARVVSRWKREPNRVSSLNESLKKGRKRKKTTTTKEAPNTRRGVFIRVIIMKFLVCLEGVSFSTPTEAR